MPSPTSFDIPWLLLSPSSLLFMLEPPRDRFWFGLLLGEVGWQDIVAVAERNMSSSSSSSLLSSLLLSLLLSLLSFFSSPLMPCRYRTKFLSLFFKWSRSDRYCFHTTFNCSTNVPINSLNLSKAFMGVRISLMEFTKLFEPVGANNLHKYFLVCLSLPLIASCNRFFTSFKWALA